MVAWVLSTDGPRGRTAEGRKRTEVRGATEQDVGGGGRKGSWSAGSFRKDNYSWRAAGVDPAGANSAGADTARAFAWFTESRVEAGAVRCFARHIESGMVARAVGGSADVLKAR